MAFFDLWLALALRLVLTLHSLSDKTLVVSRRGWGRWPVNQPQANALAMGSRGSATQPLPHRDVSSTGPPPCFCPLRASVLRPPVGREAPRQPARDRAARTPLADHTPAIASFAIRHRICRTPRTVQANCLDPVSTLPSDRLSRRRERTNGAPRPVEGGRGTWPRKRRKRGPRSSRR